MIKEIAFVGYPTTNIKKARAFYEGVLGLKPSKEFGTKGPWIEYEVGESTFTIGKMDEWKPSKDGPCVAFEADNFEKTLAKVKKSRAKIVLDAQSFPNCKMAIVRDPDGNQVVIHQRNKK